METTGLDSYLFGGRKRQLVYKALDASTMRGRAIAQNIANVTTPGYQRKEVAFEEQVKQALEIKLRGDTTNSEHIEIGPEAEIAKLRAMSYEANDPTLPGEINNVDIDLESSKMAENQIAYSYFTKFASFEKFLAAIKGQM
jgi:flagellar basal-body rod protein FlgB